MSVTIHATAVAIGGRAVLLLGGSGAGKSDLALRLIDRGAVLVSDDYTTLEAVDDALFASPPPTIAGRIEVRGLGILATPYLVRAPVVLAIRLGTEERMPEPRVTILDGRRVPEVTIDPRPASAPIKVEMAMERTTA